MIHPILYGRQIDYIKPIYEFKDKIFHVHYKDIKVYRDKLDDVGIMATPLQLCHLNYQDLVMLIGVNMFQL